VPGEEIADLQRRIAVTRWPSQEFVADRSQGVQLAMIQELTGYWATDYDWHKCYAKLNAIPQFTTEIDGVDINFIHVKSPHENTMPLIMMRRPFSQDCTTATTAGQGGSAALRPAPLVAACGPWGADPPRRTGQATDPQIGSAHRQRSAHGPP
jgi:hypothetical protein